MLHQEVVQERVSLLTLPACRRASGTAQLARLPSSSLISRIMATERIETLLDEQRRFPPPPQFTAQAHVQSPDVYERARRDPEGYWAEWAKQLEWSRPWDRVLEWKPPHAKWFLGGKLNA